MEQPKQATADAKIEVVVQPAQIQPEKAVAPQDLGNKQEAAKSILPPKEGNALAGAVQK